MSIRIRTIIILIFCLPFIPNAFAKVVKPGVTPSEIAKEIEHQIKSLETGLADKFTILSHNGKFLKDWHSLSENIKAIKRGLTTVYGQMNLKIPGLTNEYRIEAFLDILPNGEFKKEFTIFSESNRKNFEASIPDFMKELKVQRFLLKTFNPELVNEFDPNKKGEKPADKFDEIVIGLGIHGMATELVTVLDDCEKMVRNGEEIVKMNFSSEDLQKFEKLANLERMHRVVHSAIELHNILKSKSENTTMGDRLGKDFDIVQKKYWKLEFDLRQMMGYVDSQVPIGLPWPSSAKDGQDSAKEMATDAGEQQRDKSLEHRMLAQIGQINQMYHEKEEEHEKRMYEVLQVYQPYHHRMEEYDNSIPSAYSLLILENEKSREWLYNLQEWTASAPLFNTVQDNVKIYPPGFAELFISTKTYIGLNSQALTILKLAQICKEFDEEKDNIDQWDKFRLKRLKIFEHYLTPIGKLRPMVWSALIFHMAMQNWYLEKNQTNAKKVRAAANGLKAVMLNFSANPITAKDAEELAKCQQIKLEKKKFIKFMGMPADWAIYYEHHEHDHYSKRSIKIPPKPKDMGHHQEWMLLVSIGKLYNHFYMEVEAILNELGEGQKKGI